MTWLIVLLAYACFAAFGLLVSLWWSWRIELRAERRRSTALRAARVTRTGTSRRGDWRPI